MQLTTWIGVAMGVVMITAVKGPPPVVLDLGPVVPTPAPTPRGGERKRLITTITVQNATSQAETVVSFEATEIADEGHDKVRTVASKSYSLADDNPKLKEMSGKILRQVRELEREMLKYVEIAGPPKERAPLGPEEMGVGGSRPSR